MDYITTKQAAEIWKVSQRRVAILCAQNRINGALKAGKTWLIPKDTSKPIDLRMEESYQVDTCVEEPETKYLVKTELMLNPSLVQHAKNYYFKQGKTLSDGINDYMNELIHTNKNYQNTYPKGFFNLFGCAPELEITEEMYDLPPEAVEL